MAEQRTHRCPKCNGVGCKLCCLTGAISKRWWEYYRDEAKLGRWPWADLPAEVWENPEQLREPAQ